MTRGPFTELYQVHSTSQVGSISRYTNVCLTAVVPEGVATQKGRAGGEVGKGVPA
jgi:hypothetical protein